jgi:hypothetical protein
MLGTPAPIPHEPPGSSRLPAAIGVLGAAFLVFFAALAVVDGGRNTWALALLGVFAALVAGAVALVVERR